MTISQGPLTIWALAVNWRMSFGRAEHFFDHFFQRQQVAMMDGSFSPDLPSKTSENNLQTASGKLDTPLKSNRSFNPLGAFTSAASAASYVAGAAYDGLLGAATTPSTSSTAHAGDDEAPKGDATASLVAERAQVMAFHLSEMLIFA
ncbi:unnamed protein product, partial [Durusdinium trenchii]